MREIKPLSEMSDEEVIAELAALRARRQQRSEGASTRKRNANGGSERTAPRGGGRKRQIETLDIDDDIEGLDDVIEEVAE